MGVLAGDRHLVPADALHALDHADGLVHRLQDRALLDMRLEEGRHLAPTAFALAGIADTLQLLADGLAVHVLARQPVFEIEGAGIDARSDHGRREARALLV